MSRTKKILAAVGAVIALATGLACEGKPQGPGEPRCVDNDGRPTRCPDRW